MNVRANNIAENAEVILSSVRSLKYPRISIVDLFVTRDCNFACDYCFVEGKDKKHASWEVLEATVKFLLRESREKDECHILLFGGEPLLALDSITEFIPYALREFQRRGKKLTFSLTTNGSLITPRVMAFFREYQINLLLSLDGGRESHDAQEVPRRRRYLRRD